MVQCDLTKVEEDALKTRLYFKDHGLLGRGFILVKYTVTLFRSSIGNGIQSVSELEPVLGLCHIYNLVVDLQQETPYFFAAQLKADSDSGVTRKEKKLAMWGNPLQIFGCLLQLMKLNLILK